MSKKTIGSLIVRLGMDAKDADKALKKFEIDLKNTGRRMESVGKSMTKGLTVPILGFAAMSVKAASDAEETFSKFGVVFSQVGAKADKAFKDLRNNYGLGSTASKQLLSDTGNLLQGFGYSQEAALDMSLQVNKLAVDLASFTNYSGGAKGASEALTKALLGEREQAKSLGIAILEVDVTKQMAIDKSKGLTFETERQAKAYATMQIMFTQSKNAMGDYARTSDSFANQTRLLKERFNDLSVQVGTMLLPAAKKLIDSAQKLVQWFTDLTPATKEWVVQIAGLVALAGPVVWFTGKIMSLAVAFKALGVNMSAVGKGGVYGATFFGLLEGAKALDSAIYKDENGKRKVYTDEKGQYTLGVGQRAKYYIPKPISDTSRNSASGLMSSLNPFGSAFYGSQSSDPVTTPSPIMPYGGLKEKVKRAEIEFDRIGSLKLADSLLGVKKAADFFAFEYNPQRANGISSIKPGDFNYKSPGPSASPEDFLVPDTSEGLTSTIEDLENYKSVWLSVGEAISSSVQSMANAMAAGENAFIAFGKAALIAAGDIAKALLIESFMHAVKDSAKKAGLPGLIIGAALGVAAISVVQGMISNIGTPKLAQGGLAYGPTQAIVGDNPNAHIDPEVISPLSKLKNIMGAGGGQRIEVVGMIRGDDIHFQTAKAEYRAQRRGSGNVINF